ncbi:MAG: methyltransferase domain-containing protein [Candidatus Omnitrophica bacterium]|nr:methyltransferase domain-containing protein [Candidatus Omnitrophota bacterium]
MRNDTAVMEGVLRSATMHQEWQENFLSGENESFYNRVFDDFFQSLRIAPGTKFLDAGCGPSHKSVLLAQRGCEVDAVDFSEFILRQAEKYIRDKQLTERIHLQRDNLLALSYPDGHFSHVLCWGVLLHVPQVEKAIAELARVVKPGGYLIVTENNMRSLQLVVQRRLRRFFSKNVVRFERKPSGLESWRETDVGPVLARQTDMRWFIQAFEAQDLRLCQHKACQFSEIYTSLRSPFLKKLVHGFNDFWFQHIKNPGWALGNLFIFQKNNH